MPSSAHSFTKAEKLCGKTSIAHLMDKGRWGYTAHLKFCFLPREAAGDEAQLPSRLLASVSKKFFKRAVKRNLLKRRIREAYRLNKESIARPVDLMIYYNCAEILSSEAVAVEVREILSRI